MTDFYQNALDNAERLRALADRAFQTAKDAGLRDDAPSRTRAGEPSYEKGAQRTMPWNYSTSPEDTTSESS